MYIVQYKKTLSMESPRKTQIANSVCVFHKMYRVFIGMMCVHKKQYLPMGQEK